MRSRPRLGDVLLGAFALLLVLAVANRADYVSSRASAVTHAPAQVQAQVRHLRA
jgi:hypothetical protein